MTRLWAACATALLFALVFTALGMLSGCTPGAWNPAKVAWVDDRGCSRAMHSIRGPDAYDVAHGYPYHCETPWYDPDNSDIDPVSE